MKQYIDANKLIAKINELRSETCISESDDYYECAKAEIIEIIESLQQEQPEVDLEKETKRFLSNATKMNKGEWRGKYPISDIGFRAVARHFYELGLNARKEDEK